MDYIISYSANPFETWDCSQSFPLKHRFLFKKVVCMCKTDHQTMLTKPYVVDVFKTRLITFKMASCAVESLL